MPDAHRTSETPDRDPREEELPGDDADYEDLDELEAIGLGILQELTLIRQELQAQRLARCEASTTTSTDEYTCECGETFGSKKKAREHAVSAHNAPREDEHWQRLYRGEP